MTHYISDSERDAQADAARDDLEELRAEVVALHATALAQTRLCNRALAGDMEALQECIYALAAAEPRSCAVCAVRERAQREADAEEQWRDHEAWLETLPDDDRVPLIGIASPAVWAKLNDAAALREKIERLCPPDGIRERLLTNLSPEHAARFFSPLTLADVQRTVSTLGEPSIIIRFNGVSTESVGPNAVPPGEAVSARSAERNGQGIIRDPDVFGGTPYIQGSSGTIITIDCVADLARAAMTAGDIVGEYPDLDVKDVEQALSLWKDGGES